MFWRFKRNGKRNGNGAGRLGPDGNTRTATDDVAMLQQLFAGCELLDPVDPFGACGRTVLPFMLQNAVADERRTR